MNIWLFFQALDPAESKLFVCDTNHHQIKIVDLDTGCVSVVPVHQSDSSIDDDFDGVGAGGQSVVNVGLDPSGGSVELNLQLKVPAGSKLNAEAPSSWSVQLPDKIWTLEAGNGIDRGNISCTEFVIKMKRGQSEAKNTETIKIKLNLFLCNEADGLCSAAKKSVVVLVAPVAGSHFESRSVCLSLSD